MGGGKEPQRDTPLPTGLWPGARFGHIFLERMKTMKIQIEPNQRFGHGFQIRFMDGPSYEVYDDEPLTMLEAMEVLDEVMGREPSQVTVQCIGTQGIPSGPEVTVFQSVPDVRKTVVNGEKQPVLSARGVILLAWAAWKKGGSEQSKEVVRRYCEYISAHGYHGGAAKAMAALGAMSFNHGAKWINRTFARCVRDGAEIMRCVLPEL